MTITFEQVQNWRAAPLGDGGDGLKKDADALEKSRDKLEGQAIPDSWSGVARIAAETRRNLYVAQMTRHVDGKRTLQRALYDAESQVEEIERLVKDVLEAAKAQEFTISADGTVTDVAKPPEVDSRFEAEEYGRSRTQQAGELADDITAILGKAAAADATIANGIPAGHVDTVDQRGTVSPEVAERWATLTDAERKAIIEEQIEELAEEYGIDDPKILWGRLGGTNGSWDEENGEVSLNLDKLDDPDILHTVAHEMRHARQHEAVRDSNEWQLPWQEDPFDMHEEDGITEEQAQEWEDNFDDYQRSSEGFDAYYKQPVEADARESGKDYVDHLTEDELDRLLKEGQE
jgi:hypothetical protein